MATKDEIKKFFESIAAAAQEIQLKTGIPASVTMGQAALESGYGKSAPGNNIFGVKKGGGWTGKTQWLWTADYNPRTGRKEPVYAEFRKYDTLGDALRDRVDLMMTDRYKTAREAGDASKAIEAIAAAGYAGGDPNYVPGVKKIISDYGLSQYDKPKWDGTLNLDGMDLDRYNRQPSVIEDVFGRPGDKPGDAAERFNRLNPPATLPLEISKGINDSIGSMWSGLVQGSARFIVILLIIIFIVVALFLAIKKGVNHGG